MNRLFLLSACVFIAALLCLAEAPIDRALGPPRTTLEAELGNAESPLHTNKLVWTTNDFDYEPVLCLRNVTKPDSNSWDAMAFYFSPTKSGTNFDCRPTNLIVVFYYEPVITESNGLWYARLKGSK